MGTPAKKRALHLTSPEQIEDNISKKQYSISKAAMANANKNSGSLNRSPLPDSVAVAANGAPSSCIFVPGSVAAAAVLPPSSNATHSCDIFSWDVFELKLGNMLDKKLEDVAKKDDLTPLRLEIEQLRNENVRLKEELDVMNNKLEHVDRISRRSNIIVSGLQSTNTRQATDDFNSICSRTLQTNGHVVESRQIKTKDGFSFVFTMESPLQVNNIIAVKKRLDGSAIYIQKDYTSGERQMRYNLRLLGKSIIKLDKKIKVRYGETSIYINDKVFSWRNGFYEAKQNKDADFLRGLMKKLNIECNVTVKQFHRPMSENTRTMASSSDENTHH